MYKRLFNVLKPRRISILKLILCTISYQAAYVTETKRDVSSLLARAGRNIVCIYI